MSQAFHDPAAYPHGSPEYAQAGEAFLEVMGRVKEEMAQRVVRPRDDGLTAILHSELEGEPVSTALAEALVFMTIGGDVDTTSAPPGQGGRLRARGGGPTRRGRLS
jgi:hypothetical protein